MPTVMCWTQLIGLGITSVYEATLSFVLAFDNNISRTLALGNTSTVLSILIDTDIIAVKLHLIL